jgi:hypothetical protein
MNKFTYFEKTSLTESISGHILWISGLICFLLVIFFKIHSAYLAVGGILLLFGVNLISKVGIEINMDKKIYRNVSLILGVKFGGWKNYPEIHYLTMFRTLVTQKIGGGGFKSSATATLSDRMIKINLFTENEKSITLYITKNENIAYQIAENFKVFYGIEILDKLK